MLKKLAVAFVFLMVHHLANAQLTIYQDLQKGRSSQVCSANGLYIGTNIPGGLKII